MLIEQQKTVYYNTPKKLDRGLRWMVACLNSKEDRQDEKKESAHT